MNQSTTHLPQALLDEVRRYPTGWGGLYTDIMVKMPPMPQREIQEPVGEL
jgi:hypothetical protein